MFSIFKTAEDIQKWIDYRSNYKSQEELIKSYNPLELILMKPMLKLIILKMMIT